LICWVFSSTKEISQVQVERLRKDLELQVKISQVGALQEQSSHNAIVELLKPIFYFDRHDSSSSVEPMGDALPSSEYESLRLASLEKKWELLSQLQQSFVALERQEEVWDTKILFLQLAVDEITRKSGNEKHAFKVNEH
jgi:hypothetical protein